MTIKAVGTGAAITLFIAIGLVQEIHTNAVPPDNLQVVENPTDKEFYAPPDVNVVEATKHQDWVWGTLKHAKAAGYKCESDSIYDTPEHSLLAEWAQRIHVWSYAKPAWNEDGTWK